MVKLKYNCKAQHKQKAIESGLKNKRVICGLHNLLCVKQPPFYFHRRSSWQTIEQTNLLAYHLNSLHSQSVFTRFSVHQTSRCRRCERISPSGNFPLCRCVSFISRIFKSWARAVHVLTKGYAIPFHARFTYATNQLQCSAPPHDASIAKADTWSGAARWLT